MSDELSTQSDSPANCPRCHGAMRSLRAGEILLDRCDTCLGLWFDTLELDKIAQNRKAVAALDPTPTHPTHASPHRPHSMLCPRDRSTLITMHALGQPHIPYESCTVCGGAFLDPGELADLSELNIRERLRRFFR